MQRPSSPCCCPHWLCLGGRRAKADDLVLLNEADDGSLESALLWSETGAQPRRSRYLDFAPEHEKHLLADYQESILLSRPHHEDKMDY